MNDARSAASSVRLLYPCCVKAADHPISHPRAKPPSVYVPRCLHSAPLVDLDVSPVGELNAGQFQAESFGVRIAACGDQYMTTL